MSIETGIHYPLNLNDLPDGWRAAYFGEFTERIEPGFASGEHNQTGSGIPHLRPMNIDRGGRIDFSLVKSVDATKDKRRLAVGDVLFNNTNSPELVGKTAVISQSGEFAFSNHMTRIQLKYSVLPKFAALQFHLLWMRGYFKYNCVKHVNQASISSKTLAQSVPFIWAPLEQQESIVAELEKQFSRLDEAVANLQRVKANLKRYKASVLKAAVEGRLVETESALANREGRTYKTGEQLLQRTIEARSGGGKARRGKADLAAMPCANVKEIPDGWVWTTTGQVCECIVPNRDKPKTFSGDIPWLTLPDFDDSEITVARSRSGLGFTESEVALYRAKAIPADSVVMSCVGRFGISAVLTRKAVINQQLHAFLPSEGVAPKYLAYVLRTREQEMLEKSTATTIAYLNKENCNSISVPLPPFAEQIRIVAEVDRHVSIIREVEAEVDANLQRAQALRQATLAKAFAPGAQ